MKAIVTLWNDNEKTVEDVELEVKLTVMHTEPPSWYWFGLAGKCPYDGEKLYFEPIIEGSLSREVSEKIKKITHDEVHYTEEEIKDFEKRLSDLKHYLEFPNETTPAGKCIHFYPSEYYRFEDDDEMYISEVESGIATVNINDVVQALIDEMK